MIKGFRPESALLSSTILDFVENRLHKILRRAPVDYTNDVRVIADIDNFISIQRRSNVEVQTSVLQKVYVECNFFVLRGGLEHLPFLHLYCYQRESVKYGREANGASLSFTSIRAIHQLGSAYTCLFCA